MAHIQKIYIMTLKRANRLPFCLGALAAMETPMDIVEPVFGIDDHDYETSDALYKDAIADGFTRFEKIVAAGFYKKFPIAYHAQRWNYHRLFRKIVDSGVVSMILQDDYCFHLPYNFWAVDEIVGNLYARGDFKGVLLGCGEAFRQRYIAQGGIAQKVGDKLGSEVFTRYVGEHDTCLVLSPDGAGRLDTIVPDFVGAQNFQVALRAIDEQVDQFNGNYTLINYASRPIFQDEIADKWLPSVIHTDTFNWVPQRPAEETR